MTRSRVDYAAHEQAYQRYRAEGRAGWDTAAGTARTLQEWEHVLASEHVPTAGTALELGCGAGDLSLWLAQRGWHVHGVDISATAIDWAREKAQAQGLSVSFRVGDVLDLHAYADATFDLVLDGHCLHCIIGEDRRAFLRSARRVLRPSGCLIVKTMCGEPAVGWPREHFDPATRCVVREDGLVVRYLGLASDVVQEVREAGLQVLNWQIVPARDAQDQDTVLVYAAVGG
jgi:ubiquinone/menaquinone biosynthesis C-methylase UbiE